MRAYQFIEGVLICVICCEAVSSAPAGRMSVDLLVVGLIGGFLGVVHRLERR